MSSNWKNELQDIFRSLDVLKPKFAARDYYYHTVVFVEGEPTADALNAIPYNYATTHRLVTRTVVKLPSGGYHLHFIFDNNPDDSEHQILNMLRRELASANRILRALPKRRFPQFEILDLGDGALESWLNWLYLLCWLPKLQREFRFERPDSLPSGLYSTEFEYLDSVEQLIEGERFKEWEHSPWSNQLDPRWVTIPDVDPAKNRKKWKATIKSLGKPGPPVVSASISKQLLLASWESARFILQVAEVKAAPRNKDRKSSKDKGQLDRNAVLLLHLLIKLHNCGQEKKERRTIPFRIEDLAHAMTEDFAKQEKPEVWSFSRTQRALRAIMWKIKPVEGLRSTKEYKRLCSKGLICLELDRLSDAEHKPSQRVNEARHELLKKLLRERKELEKRIQELEGELNIHEDSDD